MQKRDSKRTAGIGTVAFVLLIATHGSLLAEGKDTTLSFGVRVGSGQEKVLLVDKGHKKNKRPSFGGHYDADVIDEVIKAAHQHGVDPKLALAVALQESNLGSNTSYFSIFHSHYSDDTVLRELPETKKWFKKRNDELEKLARNMFNMAPMSEWNEHTQVVLQSAEQMFEREMMQWEDEKQQKMQELNLSTATQQGIRWLKHKMSHAPKGADLAMQIQAFNGYGLGERDNYGVKGRVDMSKNPLYGYRVLDLMDNVIRNSPALLKRIGKKK